MTSNQNAFHHLLNTTTTAIPVPLDSDIIAEYCASLSFEFTQAMGEDYPLSSSLLSGDDLSHLRILHHRVVESVRNQCVGVVRMMKKLLERLKKVDGLDVHKMFKVGIVTSDILPETGEYLGRVLVDMLVGGGAEAKGNEEKGRNKEKGLKDDGEEFPLLRPEQVVVFGRRNSISGSYGVVTKVDWEDDPEALSGISLAIVLCSSMHLSLVEEQMSNKDLRKMVIFADVRGVMRRKICAMLKTEAVVMAESKDSGIGEGKGAQDIIWDQTKVPPGFVLPNLDHLRQSLRLYCTGQGCDPDVARRLVAEVMPGSVVKGVEEFQKLGVERLRMDLWPEYREEMRG